MEGVGRQGMKVSGRDLWVKEEVMKISARDN